MLKRGSKLKAGHGYQICRMLIVVACLILILLFLISVFYSNDKRTHSTLGFTAQKWNTLNLVQFHPTIEFRNGTDVIWQIPDSPKAVLFLAHGCNGRAVNFWDRSSSCSNCIGLPEERQLVLHALANKFAVLTISSMGRCWTFGEEMLIVKNIIRWWLRKNELESFHLLLWGPLLVGTLFLHLQPV